MNNTLLSMLGTHQIGYCKLIYSPRNLGIGVSIDVEDLDDCELCIHLGCFQIWIGRARS